MSVTNSNQCEGVVISTASMDDFWGTNPAVAYLTYPIMDPEATKVVTEKGLLDITDEDKLSAIMTEVGDARAVEICRTLYDLNEMSGGFCCQTIGAEYGGEVEDNFYWGIMTTAQKVNLVEEEVIDSYGDTVVWGAEVFGASRALAGSALTMAATAMVLADL